MPPPTTSRSARGVVALQAAVARVKELEDALDTAKAEVKRLEEQELPAAFTEDGIAELSLPSGQKAGRQLTVVGTFPSADKDPEKFARAMEWWCANGYADTVKVEVSAAYGTGDRDAALGIYEQLRRDNRAYVSKSESVHAMTLRAAIKQRLEQGLPTPVEDLGCNVIRRVRLASASRRSRSTSSEGE